ncbi:hypothetical protein BTBSAS_40045 [Brochothrix thermosphacta]|uniref:Uncharacterized protein n=1 Tax=Brochothrix thermosphacta TaxID=2756 RepID=A0A2X0SAX4_BROTH|nr:hypothetical protein BTBSAS_40045 [Brochothrix thermosphacta]
MMKMEAFYEFEKKYFSNDNASNDGTATDFNTTSECIRI